MLLSTGFCNTVCDKQCCEYMINILNQPLHSFLPFEIAKFTRHRPVYKKYIQKKSALLKCLLHLQNADTLLLLVLSPLLLEEKEN